MSAQPYKTKVSTTQLWQEYTNGMSTCALAKRYNCTTCNIIQRLHLAGYTLRTGQKRQRINKAFLVQVLHNAGLLEYSIVDTLHDLKQALDWLVTDDNRPL